MIRRALVVVILLVTSVPAFAESPLHHSSHHALRTTDPWLHEVIHDGLVRSATFGTLLDRLNDSDVVVYVQGDPRHNPRLEGRLTFLSSAGGRRYIVVRVAFVGDGLRQAALLGHELRHAVEIADAPDVVDESSLERAYLRIGQRTNRHGGHQTFDTISAIETGDRVWLEMLGRDGPAGGYDTAR